ncbi:Zinc finger, C2H2-like protein [Kalmanozyma brasiliensis GHG001]|uniref:Zinc finger, C2H2-like protein n=1 Tax=Kalmanozyma brasiliensis (strain GHG001) TaxID=1365824 RepID=UPI002868106D|nr:Zinc finger, C2H2-like protein [Kalmanozyma brasiliensis GHG001]KAF6767118.1 Zinc finger, C2H2-like protein [Kalmanozyma brasiliensis GHG001]
MFSYLEFSPWSTPPHDTSSFPPVASPHVGNASEPSLVAKAVDRLNHPPSAAVDHAPGVASLDAPPSSQQPTSDGYHNVLATPLTVPSQWPHLAHDSTGTARDPFNIDEIQTSYAYMPEHPSTFATDLSLSGTFSVETTPGGFEELFSDPANFDTLINGHFPVQNPWSSEGFVTAPLRANESALIPDSLGLMNEVVGRDPFDMTYLNGSTIALENGVNSLPSTGESREQAIKAEGSPLYLSSPLTVDGSSSTPAMSRGSSQSTGSNTSSVDTRMFDAANVFSAVDAGVHASNPFALPAHTLAQPFASTIQPLIPTFQPLHQMIPHDLGWIPDHNFGHQSLSVPLLNTADRLVAASGFTQVGLQVGLDDISQQRLNHTFRPRDTHVPASIATVAPRFIAPPPTTPVVPSTKAPRARKRTAPTKAPTTKTTATKASNKVQQAAKSHQKALEQRQREIQQSRAAVERIMSEIEATSSRSSLFDQIFLQQQQHLEHQQQHQQLDSSARVSAPTPTPIPTDYHSSGSAIPHLAGAMPAHTTAPAPVSSGPAPKRRGRRPAAAKSPAAAAATKAPNKRRAKPKVAPEEKPPCPDPTCDKSCTTRHNLTAHIKTHEPIRYWEWHCGIPECITLGRMYLNKRDCNRHCKAIHGKEKELCGYFYTGTGDPKGANMPPKEWWDHLKKGGSRWPKNKAPPGMW